MKLKERSVKKLKNYRALNQHRCYKMEKPVVLSNRLYFAFDVIKDQCYGFKKDWRF